MTIGSNTAMDGCSGFAPGHQAASISNIQLVCGLVLSMRPRRKGENPSGAHGPATVKKGHSSPMGAAAAVFPQQKITESVLADPCGFTSFEQFS